MKGEGPAIKEKMNPGGGIPFILSDGEPVNESAAILRYLARACPELNQFYPKDNLLRAKIDASMAWNGTMFRK
jgi:glutathione S-transferase